MSNKQGGASIRHNSPLSIQDWYAQPGPQYVPLADVGFAPPSPVMPAPLPPSSYQFSNPIWNQMINLPGAMTIFNKQRAGGVF